MSEDFVAFTTAFHKTERQLVNEAYVKGNGKTRRVRALWDTGASNTCLSNELAQDLGLVELGSIDVLTPSGPSSHARYRVDVMLMGVIPFAGLVVTGIEIGRQGLGLLIGMEIISKGDFATSCKDGKTKAYA